MGIDVDGIDVDGTDAHGGDDAVRVAALDEPHLARLRPGALQHRAQQVAQHGRPGVTGAEPRSGAVSKTHLTLPTN
ncbi:hypothetical protein, partial [Saccharothrix longispora]|uniref:hypothetical protein n=1 Tax=Saccharothrix longispora TaxID=33920 RepID=UPI0028FD4040